MVLLSMTERCATLGRTQIIMVIPKLVHSLNLSTPDTVFPYYNIICVRTGVEIIE